MRILAKTVLSSPMVVFVYSPLLIVQTLAGIAIPFATGHFIDALVGRKLPIAQFLALASLLLTRAVLAPGLQRLVLSCARRIELNLQGRILDAIMGFPPARLSQAASGELVAKLTRDAFSVGGFVSGLYPRLLVALVTMFAAGFAIHARYPALGISFMAFIPASILAFFPFARHFARNSRLVRKGSDGAFSALFDFFHSLAFLRALNAEYRFAAAPRDSLAALKDGNSRMDRLSVAFGALLGGLLVAGEIAVLGVAGSLAAKGLIPVGDVVVYQLLFLAAMQSVQGIVSLLPETATLREGIDSLGEVLADRPSECANKRTGAIERLEFRNVTFAYPGAEAKPVVKDFSATFRAGRLYALAGANGSGKTTLLRLATAALEPQSGEILVNGVPMGEIDKDAFRRQLGIVFQDSLLVTATVRDNLTLRNPAFRQEEIDEAMRLSGFDTVAHRLPAGLDTRLGVGGQSLSGGELQRLAIARALVRKPKLLVLDEATNHLDADARAAFLHRLRRLGKDQIVLLAAHDTAISDICDETISCTVAADGCPLHANNKNINKERSHDNDT